jgi:hypothetical protein
VSQPSGTAYVALLTIDAIAHQSHQWIIARNAIDELELEKQELKRNLLSAQAHASTEEGQLCQLRKVVQEQEAKIKIRDGLIAALEKQVQVLQSRTSPVCPDRLLQERNEKNSLR